MGTNPPTPNRKIQHVNFRENSKKLNQQNAQHSTGPKIPEGNTAVRLNALKYGLRARSTLLPGGNPEDYMQLSDDLEADWQPKNRTERLHLETMATSNGCSRGLPKARGVSTSPTHLTKNSSPCWRSLPNNTRNWSVPSGPPSRT